MGSSVVSIASRWARACSAVLVVGCGLFAGCGASRAAEPAVVSEVPYYAAADFTAEWLDPGAAATQALHRIAPFSFVDQDREMVTQASLRGKIYVASFFFTSCPSICPKMTATLKRVHEAFHGDADVALVSHSVDPETDTPERLAEYARKHGIESGQWHLVTGDQGAIYELARSSYFAEKQLGLSKTRDQFLHTENMLLIDGDGHIRGIYNATLPAEASRVIEDIHLLRQQ
jgi:protein SCO1/2